MVPVSHGQGESIDFDSITLPTDLVATVDREEDDIALEPAARSDGEGSGVAASQPADESTGNAFSQVTASDEVTVAASAPAPGTGDSAGNIFSQVVESAEVSIAANDSERPADDSAGNVFSEVAVSSEVAATTSDTGLPGDDSSGNVFSQVTAGPDVAVAASDTGTSLADEGVASIANPEAPEAAEMNSDIEGAPGPEDVPEVVVAASDPGAEAMKATGNVFSELSSDGTANAELEEARAVEEPASAAIAETAERETAVVATAEPELPVESSGDGGDSAPTESDTAVTESAPETVVATTESPDSDQIAMAGPVTGIPAVISAAPSEPVSTLDEESINEDEVILGWATAWSDNDTENYLSYYADGFVPAEPGQSREEWERIRRDRLQNEDIRIIVSNAGIHAINDGVVEVRFTQRYTSRSYKDRVIKSIKMVETDDGWKFLSEEVVEELPFR